MKTWNGNLRLKQSIFHSRESLFHPDSLQLSLGEISTYSSKSPDKTGPNEDSLGVISIDKHRLILAVADGVGGYRSADEASCIAITSLKEEIEKAIESKTKMRNAILNSFEIANQKILDLGVGAGTTLSVIEIEDNQMRAYHIGDSSIFHVGSRGKLKFRNTLHSPVGYALEAGMINEKEAMAHEESHMILSVLGSKEMKIEIGPTLEIAESDSLLVCSDGLTDNVLESDILEIIRKGNATEAINKLVELSHKSMAKDPLKPDDLSLILFRPKSSA